MVTAFNKIQFSNIGVRNTNKKLQNENMDAASDLFTGMLGCARASRSETVSTGHISLTGDRGQSSNKGHAINSSKFSGQNVKTALCEDGLKTDRSFPGQAGLRPTDNAAAKGNTADLRISPAHGMIKPEAALGVQESKQVQAVFGKNGLIEETDAVSGETVKSGLRKSKPTTSVFGKNETAAKMPTGSEKNITGDKNSAAGPPDADLKLTRLTRQHHGPGNTPENQNFNVETAPPVKTQTTGKHSRGKNNSMTPSGGGEGEKAVGTKWRHSDPNGEKIIFEPEKTTARDIFNHTMENISKKISGPVQSIDHELSIGGNHAGKDFNFPFCFTGRPEGSGSY